MLACAESNFSNFKFEYLRENEFLRKTILACLSGAQMGSINEKNRGRKSRDTAPLKGQSKDIFVIEFFSSIEPSWTDDQRVEILCC